MITVCCRFAHSFKTMARREPVVFEMFPPRTVKRIISGRGGEGNVWFTHCIEGQEPDIYELWTFADDIISEVHPFSRVQISYNFTGENFHTHFFNARSVRIPFLGRISVNGSVQWLDVPRPFGETGVATRAWTEDIYVNPWLIVDSPARSPDRDPINLGTVAGRVRDYLLNANYVELIHTLQQETIAWCLSDTRDEVLSDDDWLESDWYD